ncbi:MAG TPA: sigma factor-like helix-turn-helix DNA-binding protein [Terriglobales bacterium]|nr:sigma factor-like helix-turn-helix DNA-binding protein [Terriglobales bacterium]
MAAYLPSLNVESVAKYRQVYAENRHRIYAFAFWMTDNEMAAEELTANVFKRVFSRTADADPEMIDCALVTELREHMTLGIVTLECGTVTEVVQVRKNTMRVHLERAVVQLPPTERMVYLMHDIEGYGHERISRTLGLSNDESITALHQARLRMRELLAKMIS